MDNQTFEYVKQANKWIRRLIVGETLVSSLTIGENEFRIRIINGVKWFVAFEILKVLGYCNDSRHASGINRMNISHSNIKYFEAINGVARCIYINEDGVRQLLLISRKTTNLSLNEYFKIKIECSSILCKESEIGFAIKQTFQDRNIVSQYKVKFNENLYFIDFYFSDEKIAIEVDENGHKDRNQIEEKYRQKYIEDKLHCKFIRCNPDDSKFSIFDLLYKIRMAMEK